MSFIDCSYSPDVSHPKLGPCCICEQRGESVRHEILLNQQSPAGKGGWSCNLCHGENPPARGASAVLCDMCFEAYSKGEVQLKFMRNGTKGRILYDAVPYVAFHPESEHIQKWEAYLKSEEFQKNRDSIRRTLERSAKIRQRKIDQQKQIDAELETWGRKLIREW